MLKNVCQSANKFLFGTMSKNTDGVEKIDKEKKPKGKFVVRTPTDIQRIKLQRLMENPVRVSLCCIIFDTFALILVLKKATNSMYFRTKKSSFRCRE